jgi:hypothetical protein
LDTGSGRKWLVNAFLIFLPGVFLWILAVVWASSYSDGQFDFLSGLKSHLLADYSPDSFGHSMKSLKLAIFGDVFSDSIAGNEEIGSLEQAMQGLVPTATLEPGMLLLTLTPLVTSTPELSIPTTPTVNPSPTPTPKNYPEQTKQATEPATPKATENVPTATAIHQKVMPRLDCVVKNNDGTYTAHFSYENHNSYEVQIPVGIENKFSPGSMDRGQPTTFSPGYSSSYPDAILQVTFDGESLTWHLDGSVVTASANSNRCEPIVPETLEDTEPPTLSGGDLDPAPGELSSCSMTITLDNLRVIDPAPSTGIAWVKFKYKVVGYTDYIHGNTMMLCSGGPTNDGGWDGCYQGATLVEIDPEWSAPDSGPFVINLYAKAQDESGNDTCYQLGQYTMPASCGKSE